MGGKIYSKDTEKLRKYLNIDIFCKQIEKNINLFINSEPQNEQDGKVIELLKEYRQKSTSGQPEARNVIKAQIKTDMLTSFDLYSINEKGELEDTIAYSGVKIEEENDLADMIIPFDNVELLTAREKFLILLYKFQTINENSRDGAFKRIVDQYPCYEKLRVEEDYGSLRYEYDEKDISCMYEQENIRLSFADKLQIIAQRVYEELFGLMHIDALAYMDINEVGFANDGRYIYCWCGKKYWLSFLEMSENEARLVQDRAISFDKYTPQLDTSCPEVLCHRGDNARITVTQKPYFSARNLCIRIFNQSNTAFRDLINNKKLRLLITALVKNGESICLQGGLGTGKSTTMSMMFEILDDFLHIGTVEDYFEQHVMDKYPHKRIVEGQSINGKSLMDAVKTLLRMSVDVADMGEVRDGEALFAFIQMVQSVSVAAWFTTHITNPETTVPRLKNLLTGTGRYFSEQSAVMDIIHSVNIIFQHEIVNGQILITKAVEIIPTVETYCSFEPEGITDKEELERIYYINRILSNPYNMYRLNTIMEYENNTVVFKNYPSERMIRKAGLRPDAWEYIDSLADCIEKDTQKPRPEYLRGWQTSAAMSDL